MRTLLLIVSVVCLGLGLVSLISRRAAHSHREKVRLEEIDKTTLRELVKDVEAVRAKLGRAPKDVAEHKRRTEEFRRSSLSRHVHLR
jgi:hypothetical protein